MWTVDDAHLVCAQQPLSQQLQSSSYRERIAAEATLRQRGFDNIPEVLRLLQQGEAEVAWRSEATLADMARQI